MSFAFRGSTARPALETGFSGFAPGRRTLRVHGTAATPVSSNSLAFLTIVLLLFMVMNMHQVLPNFLLWLVLCVFLMATMQRMYATCKQLQVQAHAAIASGFLGHTELMLHMPQSIALATRGRLQGLRLQLALLDREFDALDYETLRALNSENVPASVMSEEEINALPTHKYKATGLQSGGSSLQQASSSVLTEKHDAVDAATKLNASEDELTCTVCLEQGDVGEVICTLPCLHQFHAICIDPWLRQRGTCPVCKFKVVWHGSEHRGSDASFMV